MGIVKSLCERQTEKIDRDVFQAGQKSQKKHVFTSKAFNVVGKRKHLLRASDPNSDMLTA